jgi:hypothetical protein
MPTLHTAALDLRCGFRIFGSQCLCNESHGLDLDFCRLGRVIQPHLRRPFGSQHLDRCELVYSRGAGRRSHRFLATVATMILMESGEGAESEKVLRRTGTAPWLHRLVRRHVSHSGTVSSSAFGECRGSLRLPINA